MRGAAVPSIGIFDKSWEPFARMMETTVPKGQLADFRLDETS
jgi:hypothetical protein